MTAVSSLGFLRTRLDERLAQLETEYKAIYGDDIQVSAADLDGEWLGVLSERISDLDQLAEDVYNSFNPQTTTGVSQSRLVQLNGIRRLKGAYSTVDQLQLGGTVGTFIAAGNQVKSEIDGTVWRTLADVTIPMSGVILVGAQRTVYDKTGAAINTLTKIDTPVYGWQTATNLDVAIPGRFEETDEELRLRRSESTSTPAQAILDAVYGAIKALPGVRLARVYENYEDTVDANGQAPHSFYAVVEGGLPQDIGQSLWVHKTGGTTTVGVIGITVVDIQGGFHVVYFSRPTYKDLYITVHVTKLPGYPSDGADQIKAALVAYGETLQIDQDVLDTRLYTPVNTVPNHYITSLTLGLAPSPVGTGNITVPFDGLARIDASRIVVVEA